MRILVFGQSGQVATAIREAVHDKEMICLSRDQVDFYAPDMLRAAIEATDADVVINAAAYTEVDRAETNSDDAEQINHLAVGTLARAAAKRGLPLLHLSTDYVFSGDDDRPWKPEDAKGPLSVYGATKLRGEEAIVAADGPHCILRTSWVFSATGKNFVKTMLRLGSERSALAIVDDQIGGPTAARDLAKALLTVARAFGSGAGKSGIYHFSGSPDVSWADFAREIFGQAAIDCTVQPIPTAAYPTPAQRPLNSRLDCSTFEADYGVARPDWRKGLSSTLKDLMK